eukprot:13352469-Alexandrium_andersonii.AAC.1
MFLTRAAALRPYRRAALGAFRRRRSGPWVCRRRPRGLPGRMLRCLLSAALPRRACLRFRGFGWLRCGGGAPSALS